ncbi:MAG TPA: competence protein TfoX [Woeseiaceae bacterium]|nr:competence protein TfoX [Woeseiaceae bacterium]
MTSDFAFVEIVAESISSVGDISFRKMFGEHVLYSNAGVVALICDDYLFVKPTGAGRFFIGDIVEAPLYPGAKLSFRIQDQNEGWARQSKLVIPTAREPSITKQKKAEKYRKRLSALRWQRVFSMIRINTDGRLSSGFA